MGGKKLEKKIAGSNQTEKNARRMYGKTFLPKINQEKIILPVSFIHSLPQEQMDRPKNTPLLCLFVTICGGPSFCGTDDDNQ